MGGLLGSQALERDCLIAQGRIDVHVVAGDESNRKGGKEVIVEVYEVQPETRHVGGGRSKKRWLVG